jgi:hypothetical protein
VPIGDDLVALLEVDDVALDDVLGQDGRFEAVADDGGVGR